jgi:hypothetical protein
MAEAKKYRLDKKSFSHVTFTHQFFLSTHVHATFEVTTVVLMKSLLVMHDAVKTGTLTTARTGTTPEWQVRIYESARRYIAENWRLLTHSY